MDINIKINELYDLLTSANANYTEILKETDALLENYSNDERLYELKSKILYFQQKYNICNSFCDKALELYPNNINILLDKAECLYQKDQYEKSYEITRKIISIDKHNKQAKNLRKLLNTYLKKSLLERISENEFLNSKYFFILLGVVLFSTYIYYSPSNEFLSCNSNYKCLYERNYFGIFKIQKQYFISNNSYMDIKIKHIPNGRRWVNTMNYNSYPLIVNMGGKEISPFVYYYKSSDTEEEARNSLNNEIEKFRNYVTNPQNSYKISMNINSTIFIIFFPLFLFLYIAFYIKWFVGEKK